MTSVHKNEISIDTSTINVQVASRKVSRDKNDVKSGGRSRGAGATRRASENGDYLRSTRQVPPLYIYFASKKNPRTVEGGWDGKLRDLEKYTSNLRTRLQSLVLPMECCSTN